MISFKPTKDSVKVALVKGGKYNGKSIYITCDKEKPQRSLEDEDAFDILDDDDFNMHTYKKYSMKDKRKLAKALKQKVEPLDEYLVDKYNILSKKIDTKLKTELELPTGTMLPVPSEDSERVFIAGKSGSGKSYIAAQYAELYESLFPDNEVYIFTKHEDEDNYKDIDYNEILCTDPILSGPIDIKKFSDGLVIFDDCDHVQDKKASKNLETLNNDLITAGRKYNIHSVTLQHMLMNYKSTRALLNEANKIFFFNTISSYQITRYLKTYIGLTADVIKKITKLKSRWTMISLEQPCYVLHEHGIFIL